MKYVSSISHVYMQMRIKARAEINNNDKLHLRTDFNFSEVYRRGNYTGSHAKSVNPEWPHINFAGKLYWDNCKVKGLFYVC